MADKQATIASFVEAAPPGELSNVVADIKALAPNEVRSLEPAFKKYNEEQYTTVKLLGNGETVLVCPQSSLGDGRYFDTATETSFEVDHASQQASNSQSHPLDSPNADLVRSLHTAFSTAATEHFPSATVGVYPRSDSHTIDIILVANKYSPQNFWNGRWRSSYNYDPQGTGLTGLISVDVHYYEDGNVRMNTSKKVVVQNISNDADSVVREISKVENKFQEELNKAFTTLAEGSFKGLRRQLPVTRQRVEWEKIGGYRLGQDIGGGRSK